MADVIAAMGPAFLGSRLKRLAEQFQAGAARVIERTGMPVQPAHMPLIAALQGGPMAVGALAQAVGTSQPGVTRSTRQLADLGLVRSERAADRRERRVALTEAGEALVGRCRKIIWPPVERVVEAMCEQLDGPVIAQLASLEAQLADRSLDARVAAILRDEIAICDFADDLAPDFHRINAEWIESMFVMEETDRRVLEHPRETIIDRGGAILFARSPTLGVLGTCALRKTGKGAFELTKMGVVPEARGLRAGEMLLHAALDRAEALGARKLYLLTSSKCATAIHLYEKHGFRHDAQIMEEHGREYGRCDVAMRYAG